MQKHGSTFFMGDMEQISSPILPLFMTGCLSYAISTYIFETYQMSIDTILMSFCEDLSVNKVKTSASQCASHRYLQG